MSKKVTKYLVRTFSECLCIFLFILLEISVVSGLPEWETDDTVVVEVPVKSRTIRSISNSTGSRKQRQFVGWPGLIQAGPCLTSQGRLGRCTSFRSCYPYFKLPDLSQWEAFSLGAYSHDTCSYFQGNGEHAFGICCTGSGSQRPAQPGADPVTNRPVTQSPNNPVPASWPPPIPTHPPDHTIPPLPTHPPYPGYPTHPTTQRPITVQSTFQTSQWPPPLPTHPPGHPGHWPATQQPTVWPPTQKPVTQPPWPPQQPVTQAPWPPTQKPVTQPPWPPQQPVTQPPWPPQQPVTQAPWPPTQKPVTQAPWPPTQQPPTHDNEITDNSCGAKNGYQDQERIVGGQNADVGEWPWIAALFNSGRQFCGGSLIDNEHILTAAHCVAHMTSWDVARMTVRLGDHNLRTNTDTRHIEKKVKRVVRHKGFDARTLYNDVAVLTLDSPVTFSKQIRPICLPSAGISDYAGTQSTVIGWGSLRESGAQSHILQEVSIPIWTNSRCKQKYGHAAPGGIIDSFLCAGEPNRDSCSGDSGGPLMVNHGRWTQVGIVSWGIGCGKGQYPGVYTRVTAFMPWITKNLK